MTEGKAVQRVTFHIKLADKFIEIDALYPSSADFCREYLTDTIPDPDMKIRVQKGDIDYERSRSEAEDRKEGVTAYGTPWDGKHRLSSNRAVPLKAICILKASGGKERTS